MYGGTLTTKFHPGMITIGKESGHMYHPSPTTGHRLDKDTSLISSHLAIEIGKGLDFSTMNESIAATLNWNGVKYSISYI